MSYVSEAWGGPTSDKLMPGDMVMDDRGFTINEGVGLKHAKLVIPTFTKGRSQLVPVNVERTSGIPNVRIHVERVNGLLQRKYTILQGTLPVHFLICNPNGPSDLVDGIVRVLQHL